MKTRWNKKAAALQQKDHDCQAQSSDSLTLPGQGIFLHCAGY